MTHTADGVHAMVTREAMCESARKLRDTYACTPGIPLFKREFGFYSLEEWEKPGLTRLFSVVNYVPCLNLKPILSRNAIYLRSRD